HILVQGSLPQPKTKKDSSASDKINYAPVTLLPSAMPRALFVQAYAIQQYFNLLLDAMSHSAEFLEHILPTQLFKIHKQVLKEGLAQSCLECSVSVKRG
uniref:Uncharacterized protein n=1 Tax=Crocodylus porosus TaxID=8502 RepID=A0A7M4EQ35_CROPO